MSVILAWRICRRRWILWAALAIGSGLALATHLAALQLSWGLAHASIPGTTKSSGHQLLCWSVNGETQRCRFSYTEVESLMGSDVGRQLAFFAVSEASSEDARQGRGGTVVVADDRFQEKVGLAVVGERMRLSAIDGRRRGAYLLRDAPDAKTGQTVDIANHSLEIVGENSEFGRLFDRAAPPVVLTNIAVARHVGSAVFQPDMVVWQVVAIADEQTSVDSLIARAGYLLREEASSGMELIAAGPLHLDQSVSSRAARLARLASALAWVETMGVYFGLGCVAVLVWVASAHARGVMNAVGSPGARSLRPQFFAVCLFGLGGVAVAAAVGPLMGVLFVGLVSSGVGESGWIEVGFVQLAGHAGMILAAHAAGVVLLALTSTAVLSRWSVAGIGAQQKVNRVVLTLFIAVTVVSAVAALSLARILVGLHAGNENFSFEGMRVYSLEYGPASSMYPSSRAAQESLLRTVERLSTENVPAATAASLTPLTGWYDEDAVLTKADGSDVRIKIARTSEGYLGTIGLRPMAGRIPTYAFDESGNPGTPHEVVINMTLARVLGWNDPAAALGKALHVGTLDSWETLQPGAKSLPSIQRTVVGVVDEGSSGSAGTSPLNPMVKGLPPLVYLTDMRTAKPLLFVDDSITPDAVLQETAKLAGTPYSYMKLNWVKEGQVIEDDLLRPDRSAFLVSGFAAVALVLSMMVLVVSFLRIWIDSQVKSIAIRCALGATLEHITRRGWLQLAMPAFLGIAIGSVVAWFLRSVVGVSASNQTMMGDVAQSALIVIVLIGASAFPVLRSLRSMNFANELRSL